MMLLVLITLVNLLLLSRLNFFPYPELFVYPYLTNQGLIPYKDILDQHFPGLMFFPLNLSNLGMTSPEVARLWLYGLVLSTHLILYLVSKKFFKSNFKSLIPNFLFLLWQPYFEGWVLWIDSFLPIFTLSSLYFLKIKKLFWAGLFLGIALLFKQVMGPLIVFVGLYLLIKERKFKSILAYGLGVLLPITYLMWHINSLGIWKDFIFWTVTFNMTTFTEMGRKYGTVAEWARVIGVYGFGLISVLDKKYREDVVLIGLFLLASLASIYARFDFVHLQPSLPFAALLSAMALVWLLKQKYLKFLILIYVVSSVFLLSQFYKGHLGRKVIFFSQTEVQITSEVKNLSGEQDKIFAFGTTPQIYYLANRLPSGNIFVFQFPWFMVEAENRVLSGIISDQPKVVLRDKNAQVEGMNLVSYMPKIAEYMDRNYKVTKIIDGVEIMTKK